MEFYKTGETLARHWYLSFIYIVVFVTLYVAPRLILIEVEYGWVVVVGWVCKVIIVSNPTKLS